MARLPIKTGHLFIGGAIIMGLITVGIFSSSMNKGDDKSGSKKVSKAEIATQEIVVPRKPIYKGQVLGLDDVTTVKWPKDFLPQGEVVSEKGTLIGRVALQDMFTGEPIYLKKLATDGATGLPAIIPEGYRAVTISISEVIGVAGFIKPGDHVDIMATQSMKVDDKLDKTKRITYTVLQDVLILASSQTMVDEDRFEMDTPDGVLDGEAKLESGDDDDTDSKKKKKATKEKKEDSKKKTEKAKKAKKAKLAKTVTVALTPEQAQILAATDDAADLRLALRPGADHSKVILPEIIDDNLPTIGRIEPELNVMAELMEQALQNDMSTPPVMLSNDDAPPIIDVMPPATNTVEIIQGTSKSEQSF